MSLLWTSHKYAVDGVLPRPGEVIMIRYSMSTAEDCNFGPRSDGTLGLPATTSSSADGQLTRPPFHHVIVSDVVTSVAGNFVVGFFPIISYSTPPTAFTGPAWSPVAWMESQPKEILIRHLPVPAVDWNPAPPAIWGRDPLDFGPWRNSRPAWATAVQLLAPIPRTETWRRLSPPVFLSDKDLSTLKGYDSTTTVYLLTHQTRTTANHATIKDYGGVWTGISASSLDYPDTDEDDDNVSGTDPVSFWRYPGAPAAMCEMVQHADETVRKRLEEEIMTWVAGVGVLEGGGE